MKPIDWRKFLNKYLINHSNKQNIINVFVEREELILNLFSFQEKRLKDIQKKILDLKQMEEEWVILEKIKYNSRTLH